MEAKAFYAMIVNPWKYFFFWLLMCIIYSFSQSMAFQRASFQFWLPGQSEHVPLWWSSTRKWCLLHPWWFLILADEPSRCYFHNGDGVCEEFEQMTSIIDCGVYTPQGFLDQWASNVSVSHHDERCPGMVVIGQPAANQVRNTRSTPPIHTGCKTVSTGFRSGTPHRYRKPH